MFLKMLGELKVTLDDKLLKAFKERAYRVFGFKKNSLKEAVELAIKEFIEHVDLIFLTENENISKIKGLLKDLNTTSIDLQHKALALWIKSDT